MTLLAKLALAGVLLAGVAAESMAFDKAEARAAFERYTCASCHQPADTLVGPSLRDIAKRYKGKKVEAELATRIREGSEGRWGSVPHPPYAAMEAGEAELLARWILLGAR